MSPAHVCISIASRSLLAFACLAGLRGGEAPLDPDHQVLLQTVQRYRTALAAGLTAQYRVQATAPDADHCTAAWRCDCVLKGIFHRFSWRLVSASPAIAEHRQEARTTGLFTDCAAAFTPERLEWLTRADGLMALHPFREEERVQLLKAKARPKELCRLLARYSPGMRRDQIAPVLLPVAFLDGGGFAGNLPHCGWQLLHDDELLRARIASLAVSERAADRLVFRIGETEAEFWQHVSFDEGFAKSHTPAEVAQAKQDMLARWGGYYRSVTLARTGGAWTITAVGQGQWQDPGSVMAFTYDPTGAPDHAVERVRIADADTELLRYDVVAATATAVDADLEIDPSEARTIRDDVTGMTIEPTR